MTTPIAIKNWRGQWLSAILVAAGLILWRIVDRMVHARDWQKPGPSAMVATP